MPDGRSRNGGSRPGAGRRTKAEADDLRDLLKNCAPKKQVEAMLRKLVDDSAHVSFKVRHEARKLLLAYLYGKPVERQELSGAVDMNMPSPEDLKKKFAERRKSVEALDD